MRSEKRKNKSDNLFRNNKFRVFQNIYITHGSPRLPAGIEALKCIIAWLWEERQRGTGLHFSVLILVLKLRRLTSAFKNPSEIHEEPIFLLYGKSGNTWSVIWERSRICTRLFRSAYL